MQIRQYVSGYAQNFVGVPDRRAGTSPRIGFDCSGFTSHIYKEFELKASACSMTQSTEGEKIALEDVLPETWFSLVAANASNTWRWWWKEPKPAFFASTAPVPEASW